jgi:hypothetical protein
MPAGHKDDGMFDFLAILPHARRAQRVADFAERVAGRSRMQVWQRVADTLPELGPTEGRGYLRARAIGVVREETLRLAEQDGATVARLRGEIEAAALDLLIQAISVQFHQRRQPTGMRRAA